MNFWADLESNLLTAGVFAVFLSCILLAVFNQSRTPLTLEIPIPGAQPISAKSQPNTVPSGPVQILGLVNGRLMVGYKANTTAVDLPVKIQTLVSVPVGSPYSLSGPVWSPDGTSTVFIAKRAGTMQIFIGAPNGVHSITSQPLPKALVLSAESWIAWAPDGKHIAFTAQSADGQYSEVLVGATDKKEVVPISNDKRSTYSPLWLDETMLVFVSADANGNAHIVLTDLHGTNPQVVFETQ